MRRKGIFKQSDTSCQPCHDRLAGHNKGGKRTPKFSNNKLKFIKVNNNNCNGVWKSVSVVFESVWMCCIMWGACCQCREQNQKGNTKNNRSVVSGEGLRARLKSGQAGLNAFWGTGQVFPVSTWMTSAPPIQGPANTDTNHRTKGNRGNRLWGCHTLYSPYRL